MPGADPRVVEDPSYPESPAGSDKEAWTPPVAVFAKTYWSVTVSGTSCAPNLGAIVLDWVPQTALRTVKPFVCVWALTFGAAVRL